MTRACLHRWSATAGPRPLPLTWALGALWSASYVAYRVLPRSLADNVEQVASTSLPHARAWPVALPLSGLLVRDDLWLWLAALGLGVAAAEQAVGTARALLALVAVHVGATVVSQAVLALRVATTSAPRALLDQLDVGPSYLSTAGLVLAVLLAPAWWRRLCALLILVAGLPHLVEGLQHLELEDTGHLASVILAAAVGLRLRRDGRAAPCAA